MCMYLYTYIGRTRKDVFYHLFQAIHLYQVLAKLREREKKNRKRNLSLLQLPSLNYNTQINKEAGRQLGRRAQIKGHVCSKET